MTLTDHALTVLNTANAKDKAAASRAAAKAWFDGGIKEIGALTDMPDRPARPEKPILKNPGDMPKRGKGGNEANKIALLHALAHIELNAIDLAWDIIARFAFYYEAPKGFALPKAFFDDWVKVGDDEAKHFLMLDNRLSHFNATYGDLPAHDGLWESSQKTAHDFAARLAIVPMVLEARGLDVTPNMIKGMTEKGDDKTAALLQVIYDDEITHVQAGTTWFKRWCDYHDLNIEAEWQRLVSEYFAGTLKAPFNNPAREEAGMIRDWYEKIAV